MGSDVIVVGLADSPSGYAALCWAASYARHAERELRAINVGNWPDPRWVDTDPMPDPSVIAGPIAEYRAAVTALFEDVTPASDWALEFADGEPGDVLVKAARRAQLLVIGSGERHAPDDVILHPTRQYCLDHAPCPTVAVSPNSTFPRRSGLVAHARRVAAVT